MTRKKIMGMAAGWIVILPAISYLSGMIAATFPDKNPILSILLFCITEIAVGAYAIVCCVCLYGTLWELKSPGTSDWRTSQEEDWEEEDWEEDTAELDIIPDEKKIRDRQILEDLAAGKSLSEIGNLHGITKQAVYAVKKKYGEQGKDWDVTKNGSVYFIRIEGGGKK